MASAGDVNGDGDAEQYVVEEQQDSTRIGQFVVLMRVARPTETLLAAERIRRAIQGLRIPNTANEPNGILTVSIGVSTIGQDDLQLDDEAWLVPADAALYRAKAGGRNRCETARPGSPTAGPRRRPSPTDLRHRPASKAPTRA